MLPVSSEEEAANKISDSLRTKLQPESLYLTQENTIKKESSVIPFCIVWECKNVRVLFINFRHFSVI